MLPYNRHTLVTNGRVRTRAYLDLVGRSDFRSDGHQDVRGEAACQHVVADTVSELSREAWATEERAQP